MAKRSTEDDAQPQKLAQMSDEDLVNFMARLAHTQHQVVKELSRRGLWRNYRATYELAQQAKRDRKTAERPYGTVQSETTAHDA
jgi:hypothetical protein